MAKTFDELKDDSHIDNFLAGNIKVPKKEEQESWPSSRACQLPKVMQALALRAANISAATASCLGTPTSEAGRPIGAAAIVSRRAMPARRGRFLSRSNAGYLRELPPMPSTFLPAASRSMSHENEADNPANNTAPFQIEVADRVKRLPPYLFARINAVKYQKRRAGDDVIDLGMGNPSDPPRGPGHREAGRGGPRPNATTATARRRAS